MIHINRCTVSHVLGCIFYLIANQSHLNGFSNNWADQHNLLRPCTFGVNKDSVGSPMTSRNETSCVGVELSTDSVHKIYIFSLYWAVQTFSTVGYGDIIPVNKAEIWFTICSIIIGILFYCVIVSRVRSVVSGFYASKNSMDEKMSIMENFLVEKGVPNDFLDKCKSYQEVVWNYQKGATQEEITSLLPEDIQIQSVLLSLPKNLIIKSLSDLFLEELARRLKLCYYQCDRKYPLYCKGERPSKLAILIKGKVEFSKRDFNPNNEFVSDEINQVVESGGLAEKEFLCQSRYGSTAWATAPLSTILEISKQQFYDALSSTGLSDQFETILKSVELSERTVPADIMSSSCVGSVTNDLWFLSALLSFNISEYWDMFLLLTNLFVGLTLPFYPAFSFDTGFAHAYDTLDQVRVIPASQWIISKGWRLFIADIFVLVIYALDTIIKLNKYPDKNLRQFIDSELPLHILSLVPVSTILWGLKLSYYGDSIDSRSVAFTRLLFVFRLKNYDDLLFNALQSIQRILRRFVRSTLGVPNGVKRLVKTMLNLMIWSFYVSTGLCIIGFQREINCLVDHHVNPSHDDFAVYDQYCSWLSYNFKDFYELKIIDVFLASTLFASYTVSSVGTCFHLNSNLINDENSINTISIW